jgi:hypothetical protein
MESDYFGSVICAQFTIYLLWDISGWDLMDSLDLFHDGLCYGLSGLVMVLIVWAFTISVWPFLLCFFLIWAVIF